MNSFGKVFRITLSGASHGVGVLVTIEGLPAGLQLSSVDFVGALQRRRGGSEGTTQRVEEDELEILSGEYLGCCTGAPLSILIRNREQESRDYEKFRRVPRPGHVDFVVQEKYFGCADLRGGGQFSGRMTVGLVIAGVLARHCLTKLGVRTDAIVESVGGEYEWVKTLQAVLEAGDSLGGVVYSKTTGLAIGLGEPFFDSLESVLSHGLFSIPGVRSIAFGEGMQGCAMRGSVFNDRLVDRSGTTSTNHSAGVVGGLSNGNALEIRVGFRPAASVSREQLAFDLENNAEVSLQIGGRHDSCFVLRCPVIVESMVDIVLLDMLLLRSGERYIQSVV